jgi:hypothetical protein
MEMNIILGVLNLVFGGLLYFVRTSHEELKARVAKLEDTAMKRDDFKDFKAELFARLDKLEAKINHG